MCSSCTIPTTISVFNNTPYEIVIFHHSDSYVVRTNELKQIIGITSLSNIVIKSNEELYVYKMPYLPTKHIYWSGWGPFSKRTIYVQVNKDYRISLTEQEKHPVLAFPVQPEGFPIEPRT